MANARTWRGVELTGENLGDHVLRRSCNSFERRGTLESSFAHGVAESNTGGPSLAGWDCHICVVVSGRDVLQEIASTRAFR